MPLEVPVDDLRRDFVGCVVMFKNKPVYVLHVSLDGTVMYRDMFSQRDEMAPFTLKEFGKPVPRIGFVNINNSVVYVSRSPVRKYYMGVSLQNIECKLIMGVDYPNGSQATKQRIQTLCIPEMADAITNKYPSLADAAEKVKKFGGACAFDKQFAISANKDIFYKGEPVGLCALTAKGTADIQWNEGKQYLSILLDGNHEKTVRDFRPAA
jgi:hypothetical protein